MRFSRACAGRPVGAAAAANGAADGAGWLLWPPRMPKDVVAAGLFALIAYLAIVRLANTPFWDDEAQVAVVAKNFLATGHLSGWDGRNLLAYCNGALLDDKLRSINPPLDYLVTAASFRLFGTNTWAGRFPFVVAGLAALATFVLIVRREVRRDCWLWLCVLTTLGFSVVFC